MTWRLGHGSAGGYVMWRIGSDLALLHFAKEARLIQSEHPTGQLIRTAGSQPIASCQQPLSR